MILDFARLDDLCLAARKAPERLRALRAPVSPSSLGTALELLLFGRSIGWNQLRQLINVEFGAVSDLISHALQGSDFWLEHRSKSAGLVRVRLSASREADEWSSFGMHAQRCAQACGVPRTTAAQLVAALGELQSNVLEHSENIDSGLVAYMGHDDGIEFAVLDEGIGLLESLRRGKQFAAVSDHGSALRTALADGNSRYGAGSGRGMGFRPLFLGLANAVGEMRFRTGDHVLLINGESPSLINARIAQKAHLGGFLIYFRWRSSRVAVRQG